MVFFHMFRACVRLNMGICVRFGLRRTPKLLSNVHVFDDHFQTHCSQSLQQLVLESLGYSVLKLGISAQGLKHTRGCDLARFPQFLLRTIQRRSSLCDTFSCCLCDSVKITCVLAMHVSKPPIQDRSLCIDYAKRLSQPMGSNKYFAEQSGEEHHHAHVAQ